jgi:hypothetical protein
LLPIATVTRPPNCAAVLPSASRTVTWTAGVIVAPAPVPVGCTLNRSVAGVPATMLNALLALFRLPEVAASRYPVPVLSIESVLNVATPPIAATVAVPVRVPPPGLIPIAIVTLSVNPVSVLPAASCATTCTGGAIVEPAGVEVGCTANTS